MRSTRSFLLVVSAILVACLLGGGLAVKVGAGESSFHQVVVFSEVLSLVLENYVDPVEADRLLTAAYEGMLGGLDAHGAYLTAEEVREWKAGNDGALAHPGFAVLKAGRSLQVVSVDEGSPAAEAGIEIGDQIRSIDGRPIRDLSLDQSWRLLQGKVGSTVVLDVLHPSDGFRREEIEAGRVLPAARPYELNVLRGVGILRVRDLARFPADDVAEELGDVWSRGITTLLVDIRNLADSSPRRAGEAAGLFASGPLMHLRDRSGEVVESVNGTREATAWDGEIAVLVNGATAGSAEAFASVIRSRRDAVVLGESTYGLGSEARLFELENGSGLLISSALWETESGDQWNSDGITPDNVIRGQGDDLAAMSVDQLEEALNFLEGGKPSPEQEPES